MTTEQTIVYGIANCDTIKKVRNWLGSRDIAYVFHDYRKHGLDAKLLQSLESALGWENMLNRRGTTWRKLPESVKNNIDRDTALKVMLDNPAIIKRPIVANEQQFFAGFDEQQFLEIFD